MSKKTIPRCQGRLESGRQCIKSEAGCTGDHTVDAAFAEGYIISTCGILPFPEGVRPTTRFHAWLEAVNYLAGKKEVDNADPDSD